jgi:hypothetical protein
MLPDKLVESVNVALTGARDELVIRRRRHPSHP